MATSGTLRAHERKAQLLAYLERDGAVQLESAAAELGVSSMTVRRDLDVLESEGLLQRVRGGALSAVGPRPFGERRAVRSRAKQVIADKALALVPVSGAIALDASTTAGTLGATLGPRSGLTVATNSAENFASLATSRGVTPILVGGQAEPETGSFVGMIACQAAAAMLYQRFFTSASALDPEHGTSEVSLAESQVKRAFFGASREAILCIDSSKLGQQSVALGFALTEVTLLITELDPQDSRLDAYRSQVELL
ncbi:MAG: DeoR/GlpR transcriptional regulator [Microbacteriaceae bacterium]|nr:DeoR/GlpR transcriptional regulator [Microbacteriaceae bacterium]